MSSIPARTPTPSPSSSPTKRQEEGRPSSGEEEDPEHQPKATLEWEASSASMTTTHESAERGRSAVQLPLLFPAKLYDMLRDCEKDPDGIGAVVSWLPDGKAFKVHKVKAFVETILPSYFKQSKYKSFQRQLNLWDFDRVTKTCADKGSYFHPHFLRDQSLDYQKLRRVRAIKKIPAKERRRLAQLIITQHNKKGHPAEQQHQEPGQKEEAAAGKVVPAPGIMFEMQKPPTNHQESKSPPQSSASNSSSSSDAVSFAAVSNKEIGSPILPPPPLVGFGPVTGLISLGYEHQQKQNDHYYFSQQGSRFSMGDFTSSSTAACRAQCQLRRLAGEFSYLKESQQQQEDMEQNRKIRVVVPTDDEKIMDNLVDNSDDDAPTMSDGIMSGTMFMDTEGITAGAGSSSCFVSNSSTSSLEDEFMPLFPLFLSEEQEHHQQEDNYLYEDYLKEQAQASSQELALFADMASYLVEGGQPNIDWHKQEQQDEQQQPQETIFTRVYSTATAATAPPPPAVVSAARSCSFSSAAIGIQQTTPAIHEGMRFAVSAPRTTPCPFCFLVIVNEIGTRGQ